MWSCSDVITICLCACVCSVSPPSVTWLQTTHLRYCVWRTDRSEQEVVTLQLVLSQTITRGDDFSISSTWLDLFKIAHKGHCEGGAWGVKRSQIFFLQMLWVQWAGWCIVCNYGIFLITIAELEPRCSSSSSSSSALLIEKRTRCIQEGLASVFDVVPLLSARMRFLVLFVCCEGGGGC